MGDLATGLAIAAAAAAAAAVVGAVHPRGRRVGTALIVATAVLAGVAVLTLVAALVRVDAASAYVSRHASRDTPLAYRVAGTWGGMEGSLLFWSFVVAVVFAVGSVTLRHRHPAHHIGVVVTGGITTATFLLVSLTQASPFTTLDAPTGSGDGLLAVLQHPAMVYHPPILYLGLALIGVPFAITMAALLPGRLDRNWKLAVIPWLRAGWIVLGVGIVTGSQWAYAELGWGGFWAWDPVENSSLLPWLATTIALHAVNAPAGRLTATTAAAITGSFCLMIGGVYVTRSGTTGSIHAFSESPEVGRPLLAFAAVSATLGVGALVRNGLGTIGRPTWNRISALGLQSVLGATAVAAIAVGTFWPVIDGLALDSDDARRIVRPEYYLRVLAPIIAIALVAMAVGPLLARSARRPDRAVLRRLAIASTSGAVLALTVSMLAVGSTRWLSPSIVAVILAAGATLGGAGVLVTASATATAPLAPPRRSSSRRRIGVALAHGGFAVLLLGAVTASGGGDATLTVTVGDTMDAGVDGAAAGWRFRLIELTTGRTDRYEFVRAIVDVDTGGGFARFAPELRAYERQRIPTAESVIDGDPSGDTIVVLESIVDDGTLGSATFTIRTRPLMPWVWVGAAMMVAGGVVMLGRRRPRSAAAADATPGRVAAAMSR